MKTLIIALAVLSVFVASVQADNILLLSESERDAVLEFYFVYFSITISVLLSAYFVYDFIKEGRKRWAAMQQAEREAELKAIKKRNQKERDLREARMLNKPVFRNTTSNDTKIAYRIGNNYYLKIVKPGMLSIFPQNSVLLKFESP